MTTIPPRRNEPMTAATPQALVDSDPADVSYYSSPFAHFPAALTQYHTLLLLLLR